MALHDDIFYILYIFYSIYEKLLISENHINQSNTIEK